MDDYLWVLKDDELDLVRELEPKRLKGLDEDGLLDLHPVSYTHLTLPTKA